MGEVNQIRRLCMIKKIILVRSNRKDSIPASAVVSRHRGRCRKSWVPERRVSPEFWFQRIDNVDMGAVSAVDFKSEEWVVGASLFLR